MINTITHTAEWTQKMIKSRSGAFLVGFISGGLLAGVLLYKMYQIEQAESQRKDTIIVELQQQKDELTKEVVNCNLNCLENMKKVFEQYKEMGEYFASTNQLVQSVSKRADKALNEQKQVLNEVKRIATPCEQ